MLVFGRVALGIHRSRGLPHHAGLPGTVARAGPPLVGVGPRIVGVGVGARVDEGEIRQVGRAAELPSPDVMHVAGGGRRRGHGRRAHPLLPEESEVLVHRPEPPRPPEIQGPPLEIEDLQEQVAGVAMLDGVGHRHLNVRVGGSGSVERQQLRQRGHRDDRGRPPGRRKATAFPLPLLFVSVVRDVIESVGIGAEVRVDDLAATPRRGIILGSATLLGTAAVRPAALDTVVLEPATVSSSATAIGPAAILGLSAFRFRTPPFTAGRISSATESRGQSGFHGVVESLGRRARVIGGVVKQTTGPPVIGRKPLEQRGQMRREVAVDLAHPVVTLLAHADRTVPLAVLVGVRVIDPEQRTQHRPELIEVIDADFLHQLSDVRIGLFGEFRLDRRRHRTNRPVDLLHRVGADDALFHLLPHRRHVLRVAGGTGPGLPLVQPMVRRSPPTSLGARRVRALRERPAHSPIRHMVVRPMRLHELRIDDGHPLSRPLQGLVRVVHLLAVQPVPAAGRDLHRLADGGDGGEEIRGAFRRSGHASIIRQLDDDHNPKIALFFDSLRATKINPPNRASRKSFIIAARQTYHYPRPLHPLLNF